MGPSRVCLIALALGAGNAPALAAMGTLQAGIYRQVNPATKRLFPVGSEIELKRTASGRMTFVLNAVRQLDQNSGSVSGVIGARLPWTWSQRSDVGNCRLTFASTPGGLVVHQHYAFGDCGFGYGVTADGVYRRVYR